MATLYLFVLTNCDACEDTVVCTRPPPRQLVAENRWMEDENIRPAPLLVENNPTPTTVEYYLQEVSKV